MELQRRPGLERLFTEPRHRKRDWFKLALGLFTIALGLLNEGLMTFIGLPIAVIGGAWIALEGAAETVPRSWRGVAAALRVAGGLALIPVVALLIWWIFFVGR